MIAIIDYGAGNLHSVKNALDFIKAESRITDDADTILKAEKVIFPGVGNFGDMMNALGEKKLIEVIRRYIESGKPFLGICLGLQVLFEGSEESPGVEGLGIFKGRVMRFRTGLKVPQIGWNQISVVKKDKLAGELEKEFFYFVHAYYVKPEEEDIILTKTDYGGEFVSGVCKDNVYAFQFHPEKSGENGLRILRGFREL